MVAAVTLEQFNDLSERPALELLLTCCASPDWAGRVLAGRPHRSRAQLLDRAAAECLQLSDAGVEQALAGHPRIGERAGGDSAEATQSRAEQSAVTTADGPVRQQLQEVNAAYEERFDRVFLIRAAGRSPEEILADARRRLGNDDGTERREVAAQLAEITRLRVEGVIRA